MAAKDDVRDDYQRLVNDMHLGGAVSLVMSVAQQKGIVGILIMDSQPRSSQDIASELELKERYIREVLSCLAAAKLIQVEQGTGGRDEPAPRFFVPAQHRKAFEKASVFTLFNSACGTRYTAIRDLLPQKIGDKGLQYGDEVFRALGQINEFVHVFITEAIEKTPGLKEKLENGIKALEVGCGTANVSRHLADKYTKTEFQLTDMVEQDLDRGVHPNVSFTKLDIFQIPEEWHESFDWVFACDVIHDLPHPLKGLEGIKKMLKPGGHFSMVDMFMSSYLSENVGNPSAAALYAYSTFLCIPESYQKEDSQALGACWGEQKARDLVEKAGMRVIRKIDSMEDNQGMFALWMCQKPDDQQQGIAP